MEIGDLLMGVEPLQGGLQVFVQACIPFFFMNTVCKDFRQEEGNGLFNVMDMKAVVVIGNPNLF